MGPYSLTLKKRSQLWTLDIMISVIIFLLFILVFMVYSFNLQDDTYILDDLQRDGNTIMENLLSEGYPATWNSSNVKIIGLTTNGKINQTKVNNFYALVTENYSLTKDLFGTRYDYLFFLNTTMEVNYSGNLINIDAIGKPGVDKNNIEAQNLIRIIRFTIYKERPTTAYIYIWN